MTFARKPYKRERVYPSAIPESQRRNAVFARMDVPAAPQPKEDALQHQGYINAVRGLPCAHCGKGPRSEFCHSDEGKGMAIKSDCRTGWPGCHACHDAIGTQRIYPKDERRALEARYAAQTRYTILAAGLWPKNLPLWSKNA